jgi:hypothetical protein
MGVGELPGSLKSASLPDRRPGSGDTSRNCPPSHVYAGHHAVYELGLTVVTVFRFPLADRSST